MPAKLFVGAIPVAALLFSPVDGFAQSLDSGDTAWLATATVLVLFMTVPGLALFYGGMVRAGSVVSVMLQCFAIACVVTIMWLIAGYSLAFGDSLALVGALNRLLYSGVGEDVLWGSIPEPIFATFQLTFAIITSALLVGTFVERLRFSAVLLFTAFWTLLVYAPVTHWVWGGGWLGTIGVLDFAGGIVVHVTAGATALVAIVVLGPRPGFPRAGSAAAQPHADDHGSGDVVGRLDGLQWRQRGGCRWKRWPRDRRDPDFCGRRRVHLDDARMAAARPAQRTRRSNWRDRGPRFDNAGSGASLGQVRRC